jgi:hypothetical protein
LAKKSGQWTLEQPRPPQQQLQHQPDGLLIEHLKTTIEKESGKRRFFFLKDKSKLFILFLKINYLLFHCPTHPDMFKQHFYTNS